MNAARVSAATPRAKKKLDPMVKFGLGVMISAFLLIFGGMFLTRPDRSIPPYTVGSQEQSLVAIHIPTWTSDPELTKLIQRLRTIGRETRNFAPMKIHPTTPDHPDDLYHRMTVYIFGDAAWTKPDRVHWYLQAKQEGTDGDRREAYEDAVRGGYRLEVRDQEGTVRELGWIGPPPEGTIERSPRLKTRVLFDGPIQGDVAMSAPSK